MNATINSVIVYFLDLASTNPSLEDLNAMVSHPNYISVNLTMTHN
jgi:hypothetical protein